MVPKHNQIKVKQIEFVPLSAQRVLTVIVTAAGEVYNRIIQTSRVFSRSELEQLSNYVTRHYAGEDLAMFIFLPRDRDGLPNVLITMGVLTVIGGWFFTALAAFGPMSASLVAIFGVLGAYDQQWLKLEYEIAPQIGRASCRERV